MKCELELLQRGSAACGFDTRDRPGLLLSVTLQDARAQRFDSVCTK